MANTKREFAAAGEGARAPRIQLKATSLAQSGEIVSQIGNLLRAHRLQHLRHGAVIAVAAIVLVLEHGLGEIVLALIGNPRNIVATGKIGVVAGSAVMLL